MIMLWQQQGKQTLRYQHHKGVQYWKSDREWQERPNHDIKVIFPETSKGDPNKEVYRIFSSGC